MLPSAKRKSVDPEAAFAANVVKRLMGHLNLHAPPERLCAFDPETRSTGPPRDVRDWLHFQCFSDDHDLYDDIITVLSRGRALTRDDWTIPPPDRARKEIAE